MKINKQRIEHIIDVLWDIYKLNPQLNAQQALILFTLVKRQTQGLTTTMTDLVESLGFPISTTSRILWMLHNSMGLVEYQPHPTDRRSKHLVVDIAKLNSQE